MEKHAIHEQQRILDLLSVSKTQNVPGVICFDSGHPGPIVGITVCTHGNEPSGLAAAQYLLEDLDVSRALLRGRLYVVINNIRATAQFLQHGANAVHGGRFINLDMNRLPADLADRIGDTRYEVRRAQELLPIWNMFQVGLDIHSTSIMSPPMIVVMGGQLHTEITDGFPIATVLTNIDVVQKAKPASAFYGEKNARVMGIEAGEHISEASNKCAKKCVRMLLENLDMLPRTETPRPTAYSEYEVADSLILKNDTYSIVREFKTFEYLPMGTVLAKGNGPDELMPFDGHVLFHNGKARPTDPHSEALFFSKPVKHLKV